MASSSPRVVHCKREPYDVYIGRPSKWGNPIRLKSEYLRAEVLQDYRAWLEGDKRLVILYGQPPSREEIQRELAGKTLGCWCAPKACHGDVLLEVANGE